MKRSLILFLIISFVFCLTYTSAATKHHKVKLQNDTVVAGKVIEAGSYRVRLNDEGVLLMFKGSDLVVKTVVDVEPLGNVNPNSFAVDKNGSLEEIRFGEEKVVLPTRSIVGRTAE